MQTRIEIEKAENGYSLRRWKESDKEEQEDEFGYHSPKTVVATTVEQVIEIIKETFEGEE